MKKKWVVFPPDTTPVNVNDIEGWLPYIDFILKSKSGNKMSLKNNSFEGFMAFKTAFEKYDANRGTAFKTFLYKALTFKVLNYFIRGTRKYSKTEDILSEDQEEIGTIFSQEDNRYNDIDKSIEFNEDFLVKLFDPLTLSERLIVIKVFSGYKICEIAKITKRSESAINQFYKKGLRKLELWKNDKNMLKTYNLYYKG